MAIVDAHRCAILISQVADFRQFRQVAIHAENTIGEDHLETAVLRLFELLLEVSHVVVLVAEALSFAESHAIDDAGMVQLIGENRVLLGEQRFEEPAIRIEAGDIKNAVALAEELSDLGFGLFGYLEFRR